MTTDKLTPNDPRVRHNYIILNGQSYHFLLGTPSSPPLATIFLIHGWPDFSFGWRYQIPLLLSLSIRVVVPDMMGYSQTSAPQSVEFYTWKRAADDMFALARHLDAPRIFLLGHDWGGAVVYRIALWHPSLVAAIISVCTPFEKPRKDYRPLLNLVNTMRPHLAYQLQLAGPEVEEKIHSRDQILQFLNAMYGGRGPNREVGFTSEEGVLLENLPLLKRNPLLTEEELQYYTDCYGRNGLRGPLNWYRTRELNFRDEKVLAEVKDLRIKVPVLLITAKYDAAIPPSLSKGMEKSFDDLTVKEVDASHWALWQRPDECNVLIKKFLERCLEGWESKSML